MKITTDLFVLACCVPFAIGAKAIRGQKAVVKDLESKMHRRLSGKGGGEATCPNADSQYNADITTALDLNAFSQSNVYGALDDCYYSCTDVSGGEVAPTANDPSEYAGFLTLPMFNGGKNDQSQCNPNETSGNNCKIAETKIAYDCDKQIFCAAAYLTYEHVMGTPNSPFAYSGSFLQTPVGGIIAQDGNIFVEFGSGGGAAKLNVNGGTGGLSGATVVDVQYSE